LPAWLVLPAAFALLYASPIVKGTLVLRNDAGRSLRKQCAAVMAADVLDCSGDFVAGDRIYVSFRARDGGQYVVASGTTQRDAAALKMDPIEPGLVIAEQELELLWPPR
jgi:glutamate 5-kinase